MGNTQINEAFAIAYASKDYEAIFKSVIGTFHGAARNIDDLKQEADIALFKAIEKTKVELFTRPFWVYVYSSVRNQVRRAMQNDKLVHVPINKQAKSGGAVNTTTVAYISDLDDREDLTANFDVERAIDLEKLDSKHRSYAEYVWGLKLMPNGTRMTISNLAKLHKDTLEDATNIISKLL